MITTEMEAITDREDTLRKQGATVGVLGALQTLARELAYMTPMSPHVWYMRISATVADMLKDFRARQTSGLDVDKFDPGERIDVPDK